MTYQELQDILRMNQLGQSTPVAPSLDQIISGIQSQYRPMQQVEQQFQPFAYEAPTQLMPTTVSNAGYGMIPVESMGQGAQRFAVGQISQPQYQDQPFVSYGMQAPTFQRGVFDMAAFTAKPSITDVIDTISGGGSGDNSGGGYGGDGGSSSTTGNSVDGTGLTSSTNVSPSTIGAIATIGGMVTGLPLGLVSNVVGKDTIANAINAQNHAANVANNIAVAAAALGLNPADPADAAAIAAAIDSMNSTPTGQAAATSGATGTGGAAASAASAAAAAAAAAGHSDAAIGAASQAAANAAIGGASAADAAAAAADAANAAAADAADADGGGLGTAATGGIGGIGGVDSGSVGPSADSSAAGTADAASESSGGDGIGGTGTGVGDSAGGGGGGSKIICTKLYELGLMPTNIYEADQAFGKKLVNESPETYYGYVRWAKHIVNLMGRDDIIGKAAVFCSYHIATPWSLAMAEEMGQPVKASWFGKFLMNRGLQLCKLIGSGSKQTAIA